MSKKVENEVVEAKKPRRRSKKSVTKENSTNVAAESVEQSVADVTVTDVSSAETPSSDPILEEDITVSVTPAEIETEGTHVDAVPTEDSTLMIVQTDDTPVEPVSEPCSVSHKYVTGECIEAPFGFRLYSTSSGEIPRGRINGKFYVWDSTIYGERIRLTDSPSGVGKLGRAIGWANVCELDRYVK